MKIGDEVYIHGYVDEIRQNVVIIRNEGGYFGTVPEEIRENTCGDAISREAAIKAIEALQRPIMREESNYYQFKFSGMSEALGAVENLPSVIPQQRTGRWIFTENNSWVCSRCGQNPTRGMGIVPSMDGMRIQWEYCNRCGAKMEVRE